MVFKNNGSNPRGKQKARPNSMQYTGSWSCKHSHKCAQLLWTQQVCSCTWSCCACSERWTAARGRGWWRDAERAWICIWMLFMGAIFQVLLSMITCFTKVLQFALPKSCMCPTVQKLRWRRLLKACSHQLLDQREEGGLPTGLSVHLPVPSPVTGFSKKLS